MRQFFRFLVSDAARADDPTTGLDAPRLGRPLPKILSESEVERLIVEAVRLHIESLSAHGEVVPEPRTEVRFVAV